MIQKLIDDLAVVEDPGRRGALATEALEALRAANAEIALIRQAAARDLKDQGLTLQQISDRFGPVGPDGKNLHFTRIQQILKGGPTGRWAKAAREAGASEQADE